MTAPEHPKTPPPQNACHPPQLGDLMERDAEELAQLETLDNGKPIWWGAEGG
jgi:acyl-CoA reductase-like NAD-dependent aldehyde dehydrogenase